MIVEWLFFTVSRACLQFVISIFPDHKHQLILQYLVLFEHSRVGIDNDVSTHQTTSSGLIDQI